MYISLRDFVKNLEDLPPSSSKELAFPAPQRSSGRKRPRGSRQMLSTLLSASNRALQLVSYSYVTVLGVLFIFQRNLQYFPFGGEPPCASAISSLCPGLKDFKVRTIDGYWLKGWLWEEDSSSIIILHLHGNAGSRFHRLHWAKEIRNKLKCSVALFDYRGFGGNPGSISEAGLIKDAIAAITWAHAEARRTGQKLVLHLESIGSAAGLNALANISTHIRVDGIIVEGGLSSCYELARDMLPFFPIKILMRDKWDRTLDSARVLPEHTHFLSLHGKVDKIVPLEKGLKLFAAVACRDKKFVEFEHGDHNDLMIQPCYFEELQTFYSKIQQQNVASFKMDRSESCVIAN